MILPQLKKRKVGDIIFIGSEAGLLGSKNGSLYCSAKFGLRGFSQSIRHDTSVTTKFMKENPGMVRTFVEVTHEANALDNIVLSPDEIAKTTSSTDKVESKDNAALEINLSPLKKVVQVEKDTD